MKKALFSLFFLSVLTAFGAQAQGGFQMIMKITDPVEYNDYIISEQNDIGKAIMDFSNTLGSLPEDRSIVEEKLQAAIKQADLSNSKLLEVETMENDFGFKLAASNLFLFYKSIFQNEYKEIIDIMYQSGRTEAGMIRINALLNNIGEQEQEWDGKFVKAQMQFAKFHEIDLMENEFQKEIDQNLPVEEAPEEGEKDNQ